MTSNVKTLVKAIALITALTIGLCFSLAGNAGTAHASASNGAPLPQVANVHASGAVVVSDIEADTAR